MKTSARITLVLAGLAFLLVMGCSSDNPTDLSQHQSEPKAEPSSVVRKPNQNTITPDQATTTPDEAMEPFDSPYAIEPISLEVATPVEELILEAGFVRVMGTTSAASVSIDGTSTAVDEDGFFQRDVGLNAGENLIEVMASDGMGLTASSKVRVTVVEPSEGFPFTVLFPPDGFESSFGIVQVTGVTTPDAAVGVNGTPVEVNEVGIFSTMVDLDQGGNLLEITGADIQGNSRSSDVTVFFSD